MARSLRALSERPVALAVGIGMSLASLALGCGAVRGSPSPAVGSQASTRQTGEPSAIEPKLPALSLSPAPPGADLPDPAIRSGRHVYEFEMKYDRGQLHLVSVREHCLETPTMSARRMGRYALEIGIGRELIDRVRFDFPLLAIYESGDVAKLHRPSQFAPGARSVARARVLTSDRAVWARLVDRATQQAAQLSWPPDIQPGPCAPLHPD